MHHVCALVHAIEDVDSLIENKTLQNSHISTTSGGGHGYNTVKPILSRTTSSTTTNHASIGKTSNLFVNEITKHY